MAELGCDPGQSDSGAGVFIAMLRSQVQTHGIKESSVYSELACELCLSTCFPGVYPRGAPDKQGARLLSLSY